MDAMQQAFVGGFAGGFLVWAYVMMLIAVRVFTKCRQNVDAGVTRHRTI